MAGDWIKLHRKTLESLVNSDAGLCHLWINLLLRANWKPSWFLKSKVKPGQVAFSVENFAGVLGISRSTLRRRLQLLADDKQIVINATNKFTIVTICNWGTYQEDKPSSRPSKEPTADTPTEPTSGQPEEQQPANERPTADTHPKKERRVRKEEDISSQDLELANWMQELIERMQPGRKPPPIDRWAGEFRKLREIDKRTPDQIKTLFSWANQDSFWRTNILSPQKLREKWDDLELRRTSGRNAKPATGESARPTGSIFS